MQEIILDNKLVNGLIPWYHKAKDNVYGSWFDNKTEGLITVNGRSLVFSISDQTFFVSIQRTIYTTSFWTTTMT